MTDILALAPSVIRRDLHEGWSARAVAGPVPESVAGATIPATVPGCIHTDLLAAGLIDDPYLDDNEAAQRWIGLTDWTYETTFTWSADGHERHDLVFDGLDTVATVTLNGRVVLESANQHRTYRVDARAALVEGDNVLVVAFSSPVKYAGARSMEYGARPRPYPLPYEAIRKSAASFGWDWGIATATSGIWRPVRLESWSIARIAEVRVDAAPTPEGGVLRADVRVERADADRALRLAVEIDGRTAEAELATGTDAAHIEVAVPGAALWWPAGYGEQPLYDVRLALSAEDEPLDEATRRVGFRSARWDTTPDADGTPFALHVNDVPVFVKGVNWIPDDALVTRVDAARYERRLRQAQAAGINLIRIWGGGIYESDDLFRLCDELGLLTWQDFLLACAAYPEEEPLRGEIEAEVRDQIVRLSAHPSLVLLCGSNENLMGFAEWGWQTALDGATWGAHYYFELFPSLVAELAPHIPYAPGSPFRPNGVGPSDDAHGSVHLWEQWNRQDWLTYRDHRPRFVAEFGWQGPATWTTLRDAVSDDPLTPESPGMIVHQKAMEGNTKLTNGLLPHFRMPRDMEGWHWAMQLNQALAVRTALEHFRSWAPLTMGAIVWQLNDCWPVTSWAAIDGAERLKPLWHALKQAFAPRIVTIQPRGDELAVVLSNDTGETWEGTLTTTRRGFDGTAIAEDAQPFSIPPRGTTTLPLRPELATPDDAAAELVVASTGDVRGLWFFAAPRDSRLAPAVLDFEVRPVDGGTEVEITARNLVRDLSLLVDKAHPDAVTEDGLFTLLPGETAVFRVRHPEPIDLPALLSERVIRTANELVAR